MTPKRLRSDPGGDWSPLSVAGSAVACCSQWSPSKLAPGDGWLACRSGALLWSPDESRPDALLAAFLGAPDAESTRGAVTAAVVDAGARRRRLRPRDVGAAPARRRHGRRRRGDRRAVAPPAVRRDVAYLGRARRARATGAGRGGRRRGARTTGTDVGDGVVRAGGFRLTANPAWPSAPPAAADLRRSSRTAHRPEPAAPSRRRGTIDRRRPARPRHRWRLDGRQHRARRARSAPRRGRRRRNRNPSPFRSSEGRSPSPGAAAPPATPTRRVERHAVSAAATSSISPRRSSTSPSRSSPSWSATTATTIADPRADHRRPPSRSGRRRPRRRRRAARAARATGRVADARRRPRRRVDDHRHRLRLAARHRARAARRRRRCASSRGRRTRCRPATSCSSAAPPRSASWSLLRGLVPIVAVTLYELGRTVTRPGGRA